MTREEADNILLKAVVGRYPTTYNGADVIQVLLEIFNDKEELEEKLKAKDEEIETWKTEFKHMQDIAIKKDVELCKALEYIEELKDNA